MSYCRLSSTADSYFIRLLTWPILLLFGAQNQMEELVSQSESKDCALVTMRADHRKALDALDLALRATKLDLERKEKRLDTKSRKIQELQRVQEQERERYEQERVRYELTFKGEEQVFFPER